MEHILINYEDFTIETNIIYGNILKINRKK
jgi:hypothetical protein